MKRGREREWSICEDAKHKRKDMMKDNTLTVVGLLRGVESAERAGDSLGDSERGELERCRLTASHSPAPCDTD